MIELRQIWLKNNKTQDMVLIPECTADGQYKVIQCHQEANSCWCVNPITGKGIKETWVSNGKPLTCPGLHPVISDHVMSIYDHRGGLNYEHQMQQGRQGYGNGLQGDESSNNDPDADSSSINSNSEAYDRLNWMGCKQGSRFIRKFNKIISDNINQKSDNRGRKVKGARYDAHESRRKDEVDRDTGR